MWTSFCESNSELSDFPHFSDGQREKEKITKNYKNYTLLDYSLLSICFAHLKQRGNLKLQDYIRFTYYLIVPKKTPFFECLPDFKKVFLSVQIVNQEIYCKKKSIIFLNIKNLVGNSLFLFNKLGPRSKSLGKA